MAKWCVQRPKKIVFNFQQNFNLALLFEEFQKTLSEKMLIFKKILWNVGFKVMFFRIHRF